MLSASACAFRKRLTWRKLTEFLENQRSLFALAAILGEEHQSDVEDLSESSSSESEEENPAAEQAKESDGYENQSRDEEWNGGDPAYELNASDLLYGQA